MSRRVLRDRVVLPRRHGLLAVLHFASPPRVRRFVPHAFVLSTFAAAPAFAHSPGAGAPPVEVPPPPAGDGLTAHGIVKDVEAKATDPRTKKLVESSLEHAKKSLERAHGARASGDAVHARMLDGLALEWAETARDLLRAAAAEQAAASAADKAREASVRAERARALLEETQARRGRADAELEKALAAEREAREAAAKTEETRLSVGKPAAAKGSPAGGKDKPAAKGGASPKKAPVTNQKKGK